jgi:hypothetical protein
MKFLFGIPLLFTLSGCIADPYYDDSYSYTETTTRSQYIPSGSSMIYTETVVRPQIYYQPAPVYVYPRPVYRPYYNDRGPHYRPHYDRPGHDYRPNRPHRPDYNNGNGPRPGNGNDHGGRPDRPRGDRD